jgi:PAS domain S-box-containing protein
MMGPVSGVQQDVRERWFTLFEQAPLGVFVFDHTLELTECNQALARMLGSTRDRIVGLDLRSLRDQRVVPSIEAVLRGDSTHYEGPYMATTSAQEIIISMRLSPLRADSGELLFGMGMVEDITDRTRATSRLQRSEAHLRRMFDAAPDGIVFLDDATNITYANGAFSALVERTEPDLLGSSLASLTKTPEDRAALVACLSGTPALETAIPRRPPVEVRFGTTRGNAVHIEVMSMPFEKDGRAGTLVFCRDVTDRKLLQARLMQADRMVAMGTLAAGVAHEINNPLAYLSANLELLSKRKLPEIRRKLVEDGAASLAEIKDGLDKCAEMLDIAREGASRVKDIVRDLRTFSRDDERRAAVDVRRVLDACVNIAWNELRLRARVERVYGDVPTVTANESRLGQVFLNLIVNATQSIAPGRASENQIVLSVTQDGGDVVVLVKDTGTGITPDILPQIFEPFYTTKPAGVGTGLGLWICKGIIVGLGGQISVDETSPRGTTFRVVLPTEDQPEAGASPRARSSRPHAFDAERVPVLFVDDETALGHAVAEALEEDFEITVCASGKEAMERLEAGPKPAAIVCDLMMPGMTGMELFAAVKERWPELERVFVFVTGAAFSGRARDFLSGVRNPKLEKPFDTNVIRDAILAVTAKRGRGAS